MKHESYMPHQFEDDYRRDKEYWGSRPSSVFEKHLDLLVPGNVLDLGAGDGRNALFLAKQGFEVTAVDIAPTGLTNLQEKAAQHKITSPIETIEADLRYFDISKQFSNVISNFTLHFLGAEQIYRAVQQMIDYTTQGGINIIDDFTPNGPFGQKHPEDFVSPDELMNFYTNQGWEILSIETRLVDTKKFESPGVVLQHEAFALIAKKV